MATVMKPIILDETAQKIDATLEEIKEILDTGTRRDNVVYTDDEYSELEPAEPRDADTLGGRITATDVDNISNTVSSHTNSIQNINSNLSNLVIMEQFTNIKVSIQNSNWGYTDVDVSKTGYKAVSATLFNIPLDGHTWSSLQQISTNVFRIVFVMDSSTTTLKEWNTIKLNVIYIKS